MSRVITLGNLKIGGGNPIRVQSMCNTDTRDIESTVNQINLLKSHGAEIIRLAVPDIRAAESLSEISSEVDIPLVADIHFDWRLAILALKAGLKGLRINPGNIGSADKVRKVAELAGTMEAAIRVGVNSGSLEKHLRQLKNNRPEAMVASALSEVKILEETGFNNIKVSLKSSNVMETVAAARLWALKSDYPQHLGVTEAGDIISGTVKSSIAMSLLLNEKIGDTLRISLTASPEKEIEAAWEILRALNIRQRGVEIISCPTCGRCEIDLIKLAADVKQRLSSIEKPLKVSVMGCVVNGPGEAKDADIGIAGGRGEGILFVKGKLKAKLPYDKLAESLEQEIKKML